MSINAHSLILVDIGINTREALDKLEKEAEKEKIKLEKILICSELGNENETIFYGDIEKLKKKKMAVPFCIIIPGELHFLEKEALERFLI